MPQDPPKSSRLTTLAKDVLGVFLYLSAYFSNSTIYSISYWEPWPLLNTKEKKSYQIIIIFVRNKIKSYAKTLKTAK